MNKSTQNIINHIALVLDASSSMNSHAASLVAVADAQIEYLARRSRELDQETRVTVYSFAHTVECLIYDKDVLRTPSLQGRFRIGGNTALIDATLQSIKDLQLTAQVYGDHSFLIYVLTDGEENASRANGAVLADVLNSLIDNWTVACLVPNMNGKHEAKRFGFPADNVAIWDTTSKNGIVEVGEVIRNATDTYMTNRSIGTRGSKNLFALAPVGKAQAAQLLTKLHPGQYRTYEVKDKVAIAPFVENLTRRPYKLGEGYYQLSKPEKVQPQKQICLLDPKTHALYVGKEARGLLGLPDHEVKVSPESHTEFTIFVQSGSVNRNLVPGTKLLLLS